MSAEEGMLCDSDRNVLSEAVSLKKKDSSLQIEGLLFTEDEEAGRRTLLTACSYGIDAVYRVKTEEKLSDPLCLSWHISQLVYTYFPETDLILFGRLAADGDAVTLATMTAERLHMSRLVYCREFSVRDNLLIGTRMLDERTDAAYEGKLPAVVHSICEKGIRIQPAVPDIVRAYSEIGIQDLPLPVGYENYNNIELVRQAEPEDSGKRRLEMLTGANDLESAENLIRLLDQMGYHA